MPKAKPKTRRAAPKLPSTTQSTVDPGADYKLDQPSSPPEPEPTPVDDQGSLVDQPPEPPPEPEPTPAWKEPSLQPMTGFVEIRIPIAITGDFVPRRIRTDVRDITPKQRLGLNLLMEGLRESEHELASGQVVNNHVNSVRGVLELIADAAVDQLDVT